MIRLRSLARLPDRDGEFGRDRERPRTRRHFAFGAISLALLTTGALAAIQPPPHMVVAFGDSYFSGYGLARAASFPSQLERALRRDGRNVRVMNAGVAGETTADGIRRLDAVLALHPELLIVELGANDAEQGLDPNRAAANLDTMLEAARRAHVKVLLCGARAPAELGADYAAHFEPIFQSLAAKYQVALYPFILEGVADDSALRQDDGEHPNQKGVLVMVSRMLPRVESVLATASR